MLKKVSISIQSSVMLICLIQNSNWAGMSGVGWTFRGASGLHVRKDICVPGNVSTHRYTYKGLREEGSNARSGCIAPRKWSNLPEDNGIPESPHRGECNVFLLFTINWRVIALQYWVCFCCTTMWNSYMYTCIPFLCEPPSHSTSIPSL